MGFICLIVLIIIAINLYQELNKAKKEIKILHDTLDHYGMRMSNKIPETNSYYKRWFKK